MGVDCGDLLHTVVLSQGGVTASGHSHLSPFFLQDMKAKKETPQELLLYFFGFIFCFYFFKVDKLCILHSQQIFLYILHLNRSTQLLLKMQYYLHSTCFTLCKFVRVNLVCWELNMYILVPNITDNLV